MPSKVTFPIREIEARLTATGQDFATARRELHEALGVQLLSFAKQAYVVKSRGGTGSDGIKWAPLAESTIAARNRRGRRNAKRTTTKGGKSRPAGGSVAIGINTGLQLNSATPGFTAPGGGNVFSVDQTGVVVGFGRHYSKFFDTKRALMPVKLPKAWREACEGIVKRWAEKILGRRLSK